ncbi:MAG: ribosome biogenesis GTP-binding protein YihA/YsxC [Oscillospiraceae bacterium]|jgi:GTP-binding protein|nr:ribosome biogenesis GTP-binding protein YihA/YsxC [Oscillospiraceae bacterium]
MNTNLFAFEAAFGTAAQLPPSDLPEIAFCGRSNVGKSSLINCLLRRKALARTSSMPGKTVTVNFYRAGNVRLVDLPGYGYAKRSAAEFARFADLMEGYFRGDRRIALLVQLLDIRHAPSKDDSTMLALLCERKIPFVIALTKCDKLNKTELAKRLAEFTQNPALKSAAAVVPFSSPKGQGREELLAVIENALRDASK